MAENHMKNCGKVVRIDEVLYTGNSIVQETHREALNYGVCEGLRRLFLLLLDVQLA